MPRYSQPSFVGGELAPVLHARADLEKYLTGLATCRNCIIHPHGGASNRAGLRFVVEVKDSTKLTRLIPFQFNTQDTYVLEVGDQYIRVIRNGGQVILPSAPAAWATTTAYAKTDHVSNGGTNYYCHTAHTSSAADEPGVGANWEDYWHALTTDIVEIPTPYLETELEGLDFVQSADIITLVHKNHAPMELSRTGHHLWSLDAITFAPEIAAPTGESATATVGTGSKTYTYVVTAVDDETKEESLPSGEASCTNGNTLSAGSNENTVSWSSVTGASKYNIYKEENGLFGFIGATEDLSFVDDGYAPALDDTPPKARNPFNAAGDYPDVVTYHEQRLSFASSTNKPQTLWQSQTGLFHNMNVSSPQRADDAITVRIDSAQVNEIRHLVSLNDLIVLTSGGEFRITASDRAWSFENIRLKPQSYRGASQVKPIVIGSTILYVQSKGSIVRDMAYALDSDSFTGNDLSVLSSHLFEHKTIEAWAYAQAPHSIIWAIRNDGVMLGLTYLQEHEVWAWHRHDTDGLFEDVCVVGEGQRDVPYFIVNRTINGTEKRYIEYMEEREDEVSVDSFFMDCGATWAGETAAITGITQANPAVVTSAGHPFTNGMTVRLSGVVGMTEVNSMVYTVANVTANTFELSGVDSTGFSAYVSGGLIEQVASSISGLSFLEGKSLALLGDGNVLPPSTVSSGQISLSVYVNKLQLGLGYNADLETLEPPFDGSAGSKKSTIDVKIRVYRSRGGWVGPTFDDLREIKQRTSWDDPAPIVTGEFEAVVDPTWENFGKLCIRQSQPLPLTVLAIIPDIAIGR